MLLCAEANDNIHGSYKKDYKLTSTSTLVKVPLIVIAGIRAMSRVPANSSTGPSPRIGKSLYLHFGRSSVLLCYLLSIDI